MHDCGRTWGSGSPLSGSSTAAGRARRAAGRGEHDAPAERTVGVAKKNPTDVGLEPLRVRSQQAAERLVGRSANVGSFSGAKAGRHKTRRLRHDGRAGGAAHLVCGALPRQRRDQIRPQREGEGGGGRGGDRRWRVACSSCSRRGGLAALSQGVVSFEVEDRAAQAGDELGRRSTVRCRGAHGALPLDHPREQGLADATSSSTRARSWCVCSLAAMRSRA